MTFVDITESSVSSLKGNQKICCVEFKNNKRQKMKL